MRTYIFTTKRSGVLSKTFRANKEESSRRRDFRTLLEDLFSHYSIGKRHWGMIWRTREQLYGVFRKKKYIPLIFGIGYVFHVFMGGVIQRQELSNEQQELFILTSPLTEEMEAEESES